MQQSEGAGNEETGNGRLNGWKEISAHLGKSVRTAHRWEKELGLPVRRMFTAGGEIVYAFRSEIDQWQATVDLRGVADDGADWNNRHPSGELKPPLSGWGERFGLWTPRAWVLLGVAVLLGAWAAWPWGRWSEASGGVAPVGSAVPSSWRVEAGVLKVFDDAGRLVWIHPFGFPLARADYMPYEPEWGSRTAVSDIDGDGGVEVLIVPPARFPADAQLYCFNSDGTLRFKHQLRRSVTFDSEYAPPFAVSRFLVATEPGAKKAIWLVAHHVPWYPTVLQKLTSAGEVVGEFWNGGHVRAMQAGTVNGRRVILLGATNNETRGGTLVVVDADNPSGSAPAERDDFRCRDCPPGGPLAFLVFPLMEVGREMDSRAYVHELRLEPGGTLTITVSQGSGFPGEPPLAEPTAYYVLDQRLRVTHAEVGDLYRQSHARLKLLGRLDHRFGPRDRRDLFPVLSWDGARFVRDMGPEAVARPAK